MRWVRGFQKEIIHMCDMTHPHVRHDSSICVTRLIHVCDITHPYVWHDSSICVTWLLHMCDMTHSYVWHDSPICVTWLLHMCDMTHPYVCHDSFILHTCGSAGVSGLYDYAASLICQCISHMSVPCQCIFHMSVPCKMAFFICQCVVWQRILYAWYHTWLISEMTHFRNDSPIRVKWLMPHLMNDFFIRVKCLLSCVTHFEALGEQVPRRRLSCVPWFFRNKTLIRVTWLIHTSDKIIHTLHTLKGWVSRLHDCVFDMCDVTPSWMTCSYTLDVVYMSYS